MPTSIAVSPASKEDRPEVERLLQLCLQDYNRHSPRHIEDDGSFAYPWLDLYWSSERRHPYLIRSEGEVAGFVFVREKEPDEVAEWRWQIAEFFVLRKFRRKSVGTRSAHAVLAGRSGIWEVAYDVANGPARQFWSAIAESRIPTTRSSLTGDGKEHFLLETKEAEGKEPSLNTNG